MYQQAWCHLVWVRLESAATHRLHREQLKNVFPSQKARFSSHNMLLTRSSWPGEMSVHEMVRCLFMKFTVATGLRCWCLLQQRTKPVQTSLIRGWLHLYLGRLLLAEKPFCEMVCGSSTMWGYGEITPCVRTWKCLHLSILGLTPKQCVEGPGDLHGPCEEARTGWDRKGPHPSPMSSFGLSIISFRMWSQSKILTLLKGEAMGISALFCWNIPLTSTWLVASKGQAPVGCG